MRKREDEELNARQNATTERSAAAMLDPETERDLYALFHDYFRQAEAERHWDLWNVLPRDAETPPPSPVLVEQVMALYKDALFLPDYGALSLSLLRSSRGRAWFWTRWSYEESKQFLVLQEWLTRRGGVPDSALKHLSDELLAVGRWQPPFDDAPAVFVDALLYEFGEQDALRALKAQATTEGESVLVQIADLLLADDAAHEAFLAATLRRIAVSYPRQLDDALVRIAATHESPTLAEQLRTYLAG